MTLQVGQVLYRRYRIDGLLGQGGFGAVYKAWDLSLERACAVKENLDTSDVARRQFMREAKVLADLTHPNLPRVTDHFFVPDLGQYLVMDFVEGTDLGQLVRSQGPLPTARALDIIRQVVDALEYLHARKPPVLHRDIKPGNIKITSEGKAVLVDFGLVKMYGPQLETTVGARAVTPGYSPPEQYGEGTTDPRSDIYSLAATLYTLLTARLPPESVQRYGTDDLLLPHQVDKNIPPLVSAAVGRGLALNPTQRFQSVSEMKAVLWPDATVRAAPAAERELGWLWVVAGLLGFLVCLGVGGTLTLGSALTLMNMYGTSAPAAAPTPTTGVALLRDDFSNSTSGWQIGADQGGQRQYQNGQYVIRITQKNWNTWGTAPQPGLADLHAEVTITNSGFAANEGFGLICDYVDLNHFYFLGITPDGYYAIIKLDGDQEKAISDPSGQWIQTSAYPTGQSSYKIGADCASNGRLTLYADGRQVSTVQDATFKSGQVGLFVRTFDQVPAEVHFDDLVVTSLH